MATEIISKRCSKCKQIKPLSEFYKDRSKKDGLDGYCKSCDKAHQQSERGRAVHHKAAAKYRRTPNGRAREKAYRQSDKGRAANRKGAAKYRKTPKGKAAMKRFCASNPNQVKAKDAVLVAVRAGRLPRANTQQCHYCPKPGQQYHHWHGYEKKHWLDVVPVCVECHSKCQRKAG